MEDNGIMNPNTNGTNEGNDTPGTEKKPSIIVRAWNGGKRLVASAKRTRGGKAVLTLGKGALLVLGVVKYGEYQYKKGQQSVTPTIVTITEGVQEEEPEIPAEEEPNNEAEEAQEIVE